MNGAFVLIMGVLIVWLVKTGRWSRILQVIQGSH